MPLVTTISQALSDARHSLQATSPSPAVDASILLCHVLGCSPAHLIAWPDNQLSPHQASQFKEILQQRAEGKPVAYITGEREFWSLTLKITNDVLIPRPDTETLVEFVLEKFPGSPALTVADIGTGSGAISCALAVERPGWNIIATDNSMEALDIARLNASIHELDNIRFLHGEWFEPLTEPEFDLIISNPPYVAVDDPHLAQGDVRFEPEAALSSGKLGMDAITQLTRQAGQHLRAGGWLIVEHGYDQQQLVYDCYKQSGFENIVQLTDLAGQPRVTAGRYGKSLHAKPGA
jgi:release factor glutamine methyltransferase